MNKYCCCIFIPSAWMLSNLLIASISVAVNFFPSSQGGAGFEGVVFYSPSVAEVEAVAAAVAGAEGSIDSYSS